MAIYDTNKMPSGSIIEADICIVGAGAAGITLATSLEKTNAKVCLIESGDFSIDEQVQKLYAVDNIGYPIRENFMSRVRYFGGSCNLWAGRSMRLCPVDFERREWVPNSGWPISYAQIEEYYTRAEQFLSLPTFASFTDIDRITGNDSYERAIFSSPNTEPAIATWATKPMRFGKYFKRSLKRSGNIDVYLNANVTEIVTAENSKAVTKLIIKTMDLKEMTVSAKSFVLAAGGLENARLMLASTARSQAGVGNDFDQVGRYFLDHPRAIFGSVRVNDSVRLPYLTGIPLATGKVQFGIGTSENYQRNHESLNCYASFEPELSEFAEKQYGRSINVLKVMLRRGHAGSRFRLSDADMSNMHDLIYYLTPKEIMPHFLYRPYAWLKRLVRSRRPIQNLSVINYCEQVPDRDSRVYLGSDTDALGMRKLKLQWRLGEEVGRSVSILHNAVRDVLRKHAIGELHSDEAGLKELRFSDASHHIGTTRMSDTASIGVVDSNCRVHGIDNLYICGSSVFPTGGYANPTLTIIALTLRLADFLAKKDSNGFE